MSTSTSPPEDYTLITGTPSPKFVITLRTAAGLTPLTLAQAIAGNGGAWCAYHIMHEPTSTPVSMGRVISDGGMQFHIIDMATLPEHQRKGLGRFILGALLEHIVSDTSCIGSDQILWKGMIISKGIVVLGIYLL